MARKSNERAVSLIVAALIGALLAGAWAMATLSGTSSVLDDALALGAADRAVASQDLAMASVSQVVLIADDTTGNADDAAVSGSAALAAARIDDATRRFGDLPDGLQQQLTDEFATWEGAARTVVSEASNGNADAAAKTLSDSLAAAAADLAAPILDERDKLAVAVADDDRAVGWTSRVVAFFVVFLIPFSAIVIYRIAVSRQLNEAILQLDARLEAEEGVPGASPAPQPASPDVAVDQAAAAPEATTPAPTAPVAAPALTAVDISTQIDAVTAEFADHGVGGSHAAATVFGNSDHIETILRTLLANAIANEGSDLRIYGDPVGSSYFVSVEAGGPGLPDPAVSALNGVDEGAFPGLFEASQMAEAMDARLEYDRVAGRTSVMLWLPVAGV